MNKCLVSKLNATITRPTPRIFGKAEIIVTSGGEASLWIYSNKKQKIYMLNPNGDVIKEDTVLPFDGTQQSRLHFLCGDISSYEYVTVVCSHAYDIRYLYGHTNPSFHGYANAVYKVDLEEFSFAPFTTLTETENNYCGFQVIDLKSRTDFTKSIFTNLTGTFIFQDSITYNQIDNIGFLGGCMKITLITSTLDKTSNVYGEFMDLLENYCFNGKTSGNISVGIYGGGMLTTFNGKLCTWKEFTVTFSNTGCELIGGTNFAALGFGNRAVFNKYRNEWKFYEE